MVHAEVKSLTEEEVMLEFVSAIVDGAVSGETVALSTLHQEGNVFLVLSHSKFSICVDMLDGHLVAFWWLCKDHCKGVI